MHKSILLFFSMSFILLILPGCGKKERATQSNIDAYEGIILSHSPEMIATGDKVVFLFNEGVLKPNAANQPTDGLIALSPEVSGKTEWNQGNVLQFIPDNPLQPDHAYVARLNIGELVTGLPDSMGTLVFPFRTLPMQVKVSFVQALKPDPENKELMTLGGTISLNTETTAKLVEQAVTVDCPGPSRPVISWDSAGTKTAFPFTVTNIVRGEKEQTLTWKLAGRKIGASHELSYTFRIPAKGVFSVNDIQVQKGAQPEIRVNFSDYPDRNQDLRGLVRIHGNQSAFTYTFRDNNLVIFPDKGLTGSFRLILEDAIQNDVGRTLDKTYAYDLHIEMQKPALRLVGNGVIVPGKDKVVFPFEAINLTKVDVEIVKIFRDNVLQFLQYNSLADDYNLHAVGRVIKQETIDLTHLEPDIPVDIWTRYAFDIQSIVNMDPGAVYQVRVGFKKDYSIFPCEAGDAEEHVSLENESELPGSIWIYRTNYPGFSYEHYENPCYPAYYSYDKFINRNVLASNLGLTAKSSGDKTIEVFASDILSGKPKSGVSVVLYDYQQQEMSKGQTDNDGHVVLSAEREPAFITGTEGSNQAYLRISEGYALSLSAFDVAGRTIDRNFDGYFYAERAVWRPGDTVFLNFVLDRKDSGLPADHPVEFTVFDARGKEVRQRTVTKNTMGLYAMHFRTASSDPTGNWRVQARVGNATFSKGLKIETVKPNRLKIRWEGLEKVYSAQSGASLTLTSNWLHGAPANGLKASVNAQLSRNGQPWDKTLNIYGFQDPSRGVGLRPVQIFDGKLDANGTATVPLNDLSQNALPGPMRMRLQTRVFETGGGFSEDYSSAALYPFSAYVGMKLPTSRWGAKQMQVNVDNDVDLVVVDEQGKPIANRQLLIGLYNAQWNWWWDRDDYTLTNFNSSDHHNAIMRDTVQTGANGNVTWQFKPVSYDNYLIRVCDPVSGHCTGDFFYTGWGSPNEAKDAVSQLRFSADKETYTLGEKATINIPVSPGSKLLITVEKNDTILSSEWKEAKGESLEYTLKTTEDMVPNAFVHVSLIQPHAQNPNDLPLRLYGVIPLPVTNPKTVLEPRIAMPDEIKPNSEFTVSVSEGNGNPMAYTIAVVDEGLLDLTHFKTPDPHGHFYARQALRVRTWDMFDLVLSNLGGELTRIFSVGGDGDVTVDPEGKEANRFPPVVRHLGPFYLEKGKSAKHKIQMPNYIGSVRTMVVACGNGRYGNAEKTTQVRQPLMVLATLPRVLSPGETFNLPVQTFAMREGIGDVSVRVETDNLLTVSAAADQKLHFDAMGDKTAFFKVAIGEKPGIAKVRISANGGGFSASQEVEIAVENPNPPITKVENGTIEKHVASEMTLDFFGVPGTHTATLEISAIPPINLGRRLAYLLRYPYGCAEQTTSSAFSQLYIDKVTELDETQRAKVRSNLTVAIDRLKQFQLRDGGFAYWPGRSDISLWSTSYVGHFLVEASRTGYYVDQGVVNRWVESQTNLARNFRRGSPERYWSNGAWETQHAYRLYTLALAGQPEWASMNLLRTQFEDEICGWLLAAAYAEAGKPDIARQMATKLKTSVSDYRDYGYTYGSGLRDRAIIINALLQMDRNQEAAGMVRDIANALGSGKWLSTQELAFAFMSIANFLGDEPRKERRFSITFPNGKTQEIQLSAPMLLVDITNEAWDGKSVRIQNLSDETLFSRVSMTGKPVEYENKTESRHLDMQVRFTDLQGKAIDVRRLARGTDFMAVVTLSNPGSMISNLNEMALTQIFPSGWEVQNERLNDFGGSSTNSNAEYQDIRDDRIYTFFDIYGVNRKVIFNVMLTAAYPGRWFMPDVYCEAMYDKEVFARSAGSWVEVE